MKVLIYPVSLLHRIGCRIISLGYTWKILKPQTAPLPVISVGNISFGGTEKTPMAGHLLAWLDRHGFKPALISRGYKGKWEYAGGILSDGKQLYGDWRDAGDEPYMLARKLPLIGVFIGKDRLTSCRKAEKMGFNIAVLDDGFQHRRLNKDIDIVLLDPAEKTALRESFSALKRSHLLAVKMSASNRVPVKLKNLLSHLNNCEYTVISQGIFPPNGDSPVDEEDLKNKKILAVCGIAKPQRFFLSLASLGFHPHTTLPFTDHHVYPPSSIAKIKNAFISHSADMIITTEKDIFKINTKTELNDIPLYYLKIDLKIDPSFYDYLRKFLKLPAKET